MSITEQSPTLLPTGTYGVDRVHSSVAFEVEYMGIGTFSGTVSDFDATLETAALAGAARIATLEVKDENLHAHLLSPEFFDAERHPEVSFSHRGGPGRGSIASRFEGEITIKGVTRPAALDRHDRRPEDRPLRQRALRPQARDHGRPHRVRDTWNADMPNGTKALADEVTLKADLSLVKAA